MHKTDIPYRASVYLTLCIYVWHLRTGELEIYEVMFWQNRTGVKYLVMELIAGVSIWALH